MHVCLVWWARYCLSPLPLVCLGWLRTLMGVSWPLLALVGTCQCLFNASLGHQCVRASSNPAAFVGNACCKLQHVLAMQPARARAGWSLGLGGLPGELARCVVWWGVAEVLGHPHSHLIALPSTLLQPCDVLFVCSHGSSRSVLFLHAAHHAGSCLVLVLDVVVATCPDSLLAIPLKPVALAPLVLNQICRSWRPPASAAPWGAMQETKGICYEGNADYGPAPN